MAHVKEEVPDLVAIEKERRFRKKWFIGIAILCIAAAIGAGIHNYYPKWHQRHLAARAERFYAAENYRKAILAAQRALQANPNSVAATRIIAKVLDQDKAYESLSWWKRVFAMNPQDLQDALALVRCAMRYRDPLLAAQTIRAIAPEGAGNAEYHSLAATVALARNQPEDALEQAKEAARLEPGNSQYQIDLVLMRLHSENARAKAEALAQLETMLEKPATRLVAQRTFLKQAASIGDVPKCVALAKELSTDPAATFQDQLLCLGTLYRSRDREFAALLSNLQRRAEKSEKELFDLLSWMNENNQALTAIEWSKRLPAQALNTPRITATIAQCYARIGDWPHLKSMLADAKWDNLEFVRLALMSRVLREEGDTDGSRVQWNLAMRAAAKRDVAMAMLQRLVSSWGWEDESEEALWASASGGLMPTSALELLAQKYQSRGDTRDLLRVFRRWNELDPSRQDVKNNVALLSLLLRVDLIDAYVKAWEVYNNSPRASIFAATFAYSLHVQGFNTDALKVLASLGEEPLHDPSIAAYCAVILVSQGAIEQARPFLAVAEKANLLPEEKVLLADAKQKVEVHDTAQRTKSF